MSSNGEGSLRVPCPLGKCGESSMYPHVVKLVLATDVWGVNRTHPMIHSVPMSKRPDHQLLGKWCDVRKHRQEDELPLRDCVEA